MHKLDPKKLKAIRESLEITQEELADYLGINYQNVARLERGPHDPAFGRVLDICEFFGIEPWELSSKKRKPRNKKNSK